MNKYKKGDLVRVISAYGFYQNEIGKTGIINGLPNDCDDDFYNLVRPNTESTLNSEWSYKEEDLELVNNDNDGYEIPVTDISQLRVGDRVKQIDINFYGNKPYAIITDIAKDDEGYKVWHLHDDEPGGNECWVYFTPNTFLKIIKKKEETQMDETQMDELNKPETELEKKALAEAKKSVIDSQIENKAVKYRDNMRRYIEVTECLNKYNKEAKQLEDVLDISAKDKKDLF